ncbi:RNA polymerase alpha subunit C-terminal domain-containing protein [Solibacillus sp. FSL K6-1523]|uniref:RNA polymerase alpha subunit C-terminal domain-containing protein n=1 Tax=Solibacillus sp. FSL K6-1523 TaxID=2921471 RepID=UPI0030F4BC8E
MKSEKTMRTCSQGHTYYKSSDCPTCPVCETAKKPTEGFLAILSSPARRALEHEGITTLQRLAEFSEKDILKLHGVGPATMPKLRQALQDAHLSFSSEK